MDKMRWEGGRGGGKKMFVFVHAQGIKFSTQGGGGQNMAKLVVECPLTSSIR